MPFPWIVTWDDHEFDNNYAGDVSEEEGVDPVKFHGAARGGLPGLLRKHAAPAFRRCLMVPSCNCTAAVYPTAYWRSSRCWIRASTGRTSPVAIGNKPPCDGVFDPNATLLGTMCRRSGCATVWLPRPSRWNVLAQQVMMARVDRTPGDAVAWSMDQWAGYDDGPQATSGQFLQGPRGGRIPLLLTGDIHTNWVNDLKINFDDMASPTVATEFVGTSITSGGDGAEKREDTDGVLADNRFVKFYNAERGYVRCEITPERWQSDYRVVPVVSKPESPCLTRASFVVENGRAGAERV